MTGLELLEKYRKKLESGTNEDLYACLGFALQLPGICGRLEFSKEENPELFKANGDPRDAQMFEKWLVKNRVCFCGLFSQYESMEKTAKDLYKLRCNYTHEGIARRFSGRVVFVDAKVSGMETGGFLFIPVHKFCEMMFQAADITFSNARWKAPDSVVFSDFSACGLNANLYEKIREFVTTRFSEFWSQYTHDDTTLNMLYDLAFLVNPILLQSAKDLFSKDPHAFFEIEQFDRHYSIVLSDDTVFFDKQYELCPRSGRFYDGTVCRLTKKQFDRMLEVRAALEKYAQPVNECVKRVIEMGIFEEELGDGCG